MRASRRRILPHFTGSRLLPFNLPTYTQSSQEKQDTNSIQLSLAEYIIRRGNQNPNKT